MLMWWYNSLLFVDKLNLISEIEKSIINANLGLTPSNDGNLIRIQFPALTEERRKELVKAAKAMAEDGIELSTS